MAENSIIYRVQEFLKVYPPFTFLDSSDLYEISSNIRIQYRKKDEVIFSENGEVGEVFYILRQGSVKLYTQEELIDVCDDGDVFGIRSLLAQGSYLGSAKATEDCILYAIPNDFFLPFLEKYPKVSRYFASGFASGKTVIREMIDPQNGQPHTSPFHHFSASSINDLNVVSPQRKPITCIANQTIQQAAQQMTAANVGSIVITDEQNHPKGIITDKDFRSKIATGQFAITQSVSCIMSSPVYCLAPNPTVNQVLMSFVKNGFHHLCITEDGTPNTPLIGVISNHDVMLEKGEHPATLMKYARRAESVEQLVDLRSRLAKLIADYLERGVSVSYIADFTTAIDDAILDRLFGFALKEQVAAYGELPSTFCWLSLGSQGRSEQLLQTDQDNALIFLEGGKKAKDYFLKLAERITDGLEKVGFERCPAGMMASEPNWCMSLDDWMQQFDKWITVPTEENIMYLTIFFDFKASFGNVELARKLQRNIYEKSVRNDLFLSFLAKNATQNPPPLSFFRNIVVEKDGENKDKFDIKARAMMPLADAARLLTIQHQLYEVTNTPQRFTEIAEHEDSKSIFYDSAIAYETLMRIRTAEGIRNKNSGRYIEPNHLSKLERQALKNIFSTINDLQTLIKLRFKTKMLG